ncbi:MAG: hypothetical protein M0P71_07625 [Melioribacteraceae bacterium]|jgi:hypothetical protein|nr:hypothetical protein [Melioribacteraceae bacterium]
MNQYNNTKGFAGILDTIRSWVSSPAIYSGMQVKDFYEKLIEISDKLIFITRQYKDKNDLLTSAEASQLHSQIIAYNLLALDFRDWLIANHQVELPIIQVCNIAENCDYRVIGTLPSGISTGAGAVSAGTSGLGIAPIILGIGVVMVAGAAYLTYTVVQALSDRLLPTAQATQQLYNTITSRGLDIMDRCMSGQLSTEQCNQAYEVLDKFSQLGEEGRSDNLLSEINPTKIILGAVGIVAGAVIIYSIIKRKL